MLFLGRSTMALAYVELRAKKLISPLDYLHISVKVFELWTHFAVIDACEVAAE
jgi:hypothetical protein